MHLRSFKLLRLQLTLLLLLLSGEWFIQQKCCGRRFSSTATAFTIRTKTTTTPPRTRRIIIPANKIWTPISGSSFSLLSTYNTRTTTGELATPSLMCMFTAVTTSAIPDNNEDSTGLQRPGHRRTMLLVAASALAAIGFLAMSSSTNSHPLITAATKILRQYKKTILRSIVMTLCFKLFVWDRIQLRKRQAVDLTSEWSRYSQYPGARGRALVSLLCFQVLPLFLLSRILGVILLQRRKNDDNDESDDDDRNNNNSTWQSRVLTFSGRVLANGLLGLGPLYIKLGQILSSRAAMLPKQWIPSLERLQDQVPAKSGDAAMQLAYSAWSEGIGTGTGQQTASFDETFYDFDTTPLAAASLGQVHMAKLRSTNETVAIKLQRPYLKRIYNQDLGLLTQIAVFVDRFGGRRGQVGGIQQSWTSIFRDAEEILYREIDYRAEAENGMRFCQDFGLGKKGMPVTPTTAISRDGKVLPSAASWLRAPYVYDDLSSEKVLVMEYVPSIKITKTTQLQAANVTAEEKEYLADCLARAYLRQFCSHYFFSTDPHPGNLGCEILQQHSSSSIPALPPSSRVRLVFYDFGQAATLTRNQADGILEIIEAIVDMNVDASIASFQKMGVLSDTVDLDKVRAKVADNYKTGKVKANRKKLKKKGYKFASSSSSSSTTSSILINGEMAHESSSSSSSSSQESSSSFSSSSSTSTVQATDAEIMSYFVLPAQYAFVGRALAQMDGVGKTLDPEFDFISSAAPWIYEIKGATRYIIEEASKWFENAKDKLHLGIEKIINMHHFNGVDDTTNKAAVAKKKEKNKERL